jgi:LuxR family maltose regulon positive regulatory protein
MAEPSTTTPVEAATPERDRLLATKLHAPRPRPGFLTRARLLERLTEGTAGALTLMCAPAGFGKTSLLGDWARRSRQPVAWLSLDGGDSDPARFWRYVAAALDELRLRAGGQLTELRETDLRFMPEEATELLRTAVGAELPEAAVAPLGDRTEG